MGRFATIILAAGKGSRMELGYNKALYKIEEGVTILEKSVKAFYDIEEIDQIIIVVNEDDKHEVKKLLKEYHKLQFVIGGEKRHDSVLAGLKVVRHGYVLIHDAARCFVKQEQVDDIIKATIKYQAATLAYPIRDTIHLVNDDNMVVETVDRDYAYLAQTPQGFETPVIVEAYYRFSQNANQINITDDVMLVNTYTDYQVKIIESNATNFKVTYQSDLD